MLGWHKREQGRGGGITCFIYSNVYTVHLCTHAYRCSHQTANPWTLLFVWVSEQTCSSECVHAVHTGCCLLLLKAFIKMFALCRMNHFALWQISYVLFSSSSLQQMTGKNEMWTQFWESSGDGEGYVMCTFGEWCGRISLLTDVYLALLSRMSHLNVLAHKDLCCRSLLHP